MANFDNSQQAQQLADLRRKEEENFVQMQSTKYGLPYIDLSGVGINTDALKLIEENQARKGFIAGFRLIGKELFIAIKDPNNTVALEIVNDLRAQGHDITIYMVSGRSLEKAWGRYADITYTQGTRGSFLDVSEEIIAQIVAEVKNFTDVQKKFNDILREEDQRMTSKILEVVLGSAIALGTSDVHFEPEEHVIDLRFRNDGVLQHVLSFDPLHYRLLGSRLKLLSGMKLTQTKDAQDGRFTISYKGKQIEVRSSVLPGAYGESFVMRILNPDSIQVGYAELGIEPKLFELLNSHIKKPHGLILTTGPTGSGKTTTLYSFLREIQNGENKIITIEDPIEYHLAGITQTQVDHEKGYDFLSGLRAALRQDPDVIMVGEIRDAETATIAVNASLTGHLVLSTIHTTSAAGVIPRLLDLEIKSEILPSALTLAIAQRLIRKVCQNCKESYAPSEQEDLLIRAVLKKAESDGKDLSAYNLTSTMAFKLVRGRGCDVCHDTGYKGRIGLYEAIFMDSQLEELIQKGRPSAHDVQRNTIHQGVFTMAEDGIVKILSGITTLEEVQKVIALEDEIEIEKPHTVEVKQNISQDIQQSKGQASSELAKDSKTNTSQGDQNHMSELISHLDERVGKIANLLEEDEKFEQFEFEKIRKSLLEKTGAEEQHIHELEERLNIIQTPQIRESAGSISNVEKKDEKISVAPKNDTEKMPDPVENDTPIQKQQNQELMYLVDYLKILESEQVDSPATSISTKIQGVRDMIIRILKNGPYDSEESSQAQQKRIVEDHIKNLMNDLEELQQHQNANPEIGVADQLARIREQVHALIVDAR